MHASIWRLAGDPDDLARGYDELLAELTPQRIALQLCLRAPDGLVIVDTCPTQEAFRAFISSPEFGAMLARHGLPPVSRIDDYPVHAAIAGGEMVGVAAASPARSDS
jgi:hypothetical protein